VALANPVGIASALETRAILPEAGLARATHDPYSYNYPFPYAALFFYQVFSGGLRAAGIG